MLECFASDENQTHRLSNRATWIRVPARKRITGKAKRYSNSKLPEPGDALLSRPPVTVLFGGKLLKVMPDAVNLMLAHMGRGPAARPIGQTVTALPHRLKAHLAQQQRGRAGTMLRARLENSGMSISPDEISAHGDEDHGV